SYTLDNNGDAELTYDLNLPTIVEKVSQMFLAIATKEAFKHKVDGTKLTLQSDMGENVMEATEDIKVDDKVLYKKGQIVNVKDFKENPKLYENSIKTRRLAWRVEKNLNGKPVYHTEVKISAQTALQYGLKIGDDIPQH